MFREHLLCTAPFTGMESQDCGGARGRGLCHYPHLSKEQRESQSLGPLPKVSQGGARIETQSQGTLCHKKRLLSAPGFSQSPVLQQGHRVPLDASRNSTLSLLASAQCMLSYYKRILWEQWCHNS